MRETAYYILFTAKKIGYINKRHTHTLSGAETSWFQFCLTITKPFPPIYLEEMKNYLSLSVSRTVSQVIYMWVRKPTVGYKLVQLCRKNPKREPWRISIKAI